MPTDRTKVQPDPEPGPIPRPRVMLQGERIVFGKHYPCSKCKGKGVTYDSGQERVCLRCQGAGYLTNKSFIDEGGP